MFGNKNEIFFASVLIILSIIIRLPAIEYPVDGDATVYAELTKNLAENGKYTSENKFHTQFPPLFPLTSVPSYLYLNDAASAVKWTSIIFSTLTVVLTFLFSRRLNYSIKTSVIIALFVLFNPWFIYFTSIGYSEGLGIFLLLSAIFFFYFQKENRGYIYYSAAFFGLSAITRAAFLPILATFALFNLYKFAKHRKKENLIFIIISSIPLLVWSAIISVKSHTVAYSGYASWLSTVSNIHLNLILYLIMIPVTFLFVTPLIINSIIQLSRDIKTSWRKHESEYVILIGFIMYMSVVVWASLDFHAFGAIQEGKINYVNLYTLAFALPRYLIPLLPFMTIVGFLHAKKEYHKLFIRLSPFILLLLLLFTITLNYGFVQDRIDEKSYFPNTVMRRGEHRIQTIEWVNENANTNSTVIVSFDEPETVQGRMIGLSEFIQDKFREDLAILKESESDLQKTSVSPTYILTEKENDPVLKSHDVRLVYKTKYPPFDYVYKIVH